MKQPIKYPEAKQGDRPEGAEVEQPAIGGENMGDTDPEDKAKRMKTIPELLIDVINILKKIEERQAKEYERHG